MKNKKKVKSGVFSFVGYTVHIVAKCLGLFILGLPFLVAILIVSKIIKIRIGYVYGAKLGHLAANVELYLTEIDCGVNTVQGPTLDIFFVRRFRALKAETVCNKFLLRKWSNKITLMPSLIIEPVYSLLCYLRLDQFRIVINETTADRDVYNLLDITSPHISFEPYEVGLANHILDLLGIPPASRIVCLNVRDSSYWPCHLQDGFRDSEIRTYSLAAYELTGKGYYVVRMGAKVETKMESSPGIIDYATSGLRSELMDVYLGAICAFAVSTGTGWDAVPYIFRRPICYVNYIPAGYAMTFCSRTLLLFKEIEDRVTLRKLTLSQILNNERLSTALSSLNYDLSGVNVIDNSPGDIKDAVLEMHHMLYPDPSENFYRSKNQELFRKIYLDSMESNSALRGLHGKINASYSDSYIRRNPEWLS